MIIYNIFFIQNSKLNKRFYSINETYPILNICNSSDNFNKILLDVNKIINSNVWMDWPEKFLLQKNNNQWNIFPFLVFKKWSIKNIQLCPNIYNLLKIIQDNLLFNSDNKLELINASLSRLSAGTILKPHQGWAKLSNNILRCHLGIIIPGESHIYVESEKQKVEVNKWIIFDDSKIHWADNNSNSDRIILLLDIKRPDFIEIGKSEISDTSEVKTFINSFNQIN